MVVAVPADTPQDRLVSLRDGLREFAEAHGRVLPERVDIYFNGTNGSGLDLLVNLYLRVRTASDELEVRDELTREILHRIQSARTGQDEPRRSNQIAHPAEAGGAIPRPNLSARPTTTPAAPTASVPRREEL